MFERLHRYFLDVVKAELDKHHILDINNVQAMILHNIGHDELTVGELTLRGYYLGSNVSYNVKKMVETGYIEQQRSVHDKRSFRVKLTEKGKKLHKMITDMFSKHEEKLKSTEVNDKTLHDIISVMRQLERFLASQSSFSGLASLDDEDEI
ncbi:MAG: winged helix DNA-binding protein [Alphaproteobacteria bacterium]|nr:winged helix DNA-binding protein [Alphaproteobacteria bacterium]